jgi:indole-3-glycerol phosphate synthase
MNLLEHIVTSKKDEVARRKRDEALSSFRSHELFSRTALSLSSHFGAERPFGIIAEIKRASPSSGEFGRDVDPSSLALEYEDAGAAGISVLTDAEFFTVPSKTYKRYGGPSRCRCSEGLYHRRVPDSRGEGQWGGCRSLLIAAALDRSHIADLASAADELGLEYLVELYEAKEMDKLDFDRMRFIGINNRDLRTFKVDLNRSVEIKSSLPAGVTVISESGIRYRAEIAYLRERGIHGALIGESLVRSESPGTTLRELLKSQVDAPTR